MHQIHVLCYPSHSTHLYQGLDVVIFSVLKRHWSGSRDDYERETGLRVTKSTFLRVYTRAHLNALTVENIVSAFCKTGVVPFNPSVITEQMMAPSITTSIRGSLPIPQATPIRVLQDLIQWHLACATASDLYESGDNVPSSSTGLTANTEPSDTPTRTAVAELTSISGSLLGTASPSHKTFTLPQFKPYTITPFKPSRHMELLVRTPVTA